jgi:HEPN domain-containing protein
MFDGGRYPYALFMCHLAVEKALKGLYQHRLGKTPPRTHNLVYLMAQVGLEPDQDQARFVAVLSEAQAATRYPQDLEALRSQYTQSVAEDALSKGRSLLTWIESKF